MAIDNRSFVEDMAIVYCAMDTCTAICEWFGEGNDVLTEEVFKTFMSGASKKHAIDTINFLEGNSRKI